LTAHIATVARSRPWSLANDAKTRKNRVQIDSVFGCFIIASGEPLI
jgi:hypothetical protein